MESVEKTSDDVREGVPPVPAKTEEPKAPTDTSSKSPEGESKTNGGSDGTKKTPKEKCGKKHAKRKQKKAKKQASGTASSSESGSDGGADSSSTSDSDESQSESEDTKKKRVTKKRQDIQKSKKKTRAKKSKKPVKAKTESVSDSDSDSSDSEPDDNTEDDNEDQRNQQQDLAGRLALMQLQQFQQSQNAYQYPNPTHQYGSIGGNIPPIYDSGMRLNAVPPRGRTRRGGAHATGRNLGLGSIDPNLLLDGKQQKDRLKKQKATKLDYKRVDQVWDNTIHNYKLQDTAEGTIDAQYDEFLFHVRRTFDWEGKYKATIIDIKSKLLRECLQDVMGNIKGVSLVEETPKLDPNMLFLYLEDLKKHLKELKKSKPPKGDKHERKKQQKRLDSKRLHLRVLIKYIDKDYADTKKR